MEIREKRKPIVKKYEDYSPFDSRRKRIQYNINRKQKKKIYKSQRLSQNAQFSKEEDQRIVQLVQQMGPKFVKISTFFPNKSYSMVKNRYYKHLRDQTQQVSDLTQCSPRPQQNEKVQELNQLMQSINFSPEITEITKSFLGELQKCLN